MMLCYENKTKLIYNKKSFRNPYFIAFRRSKLDISGLILAAGRGNRMGNLTNDQPKGFLKVGNKKLIDWQLDALFSNGIKDNSIVVGYKNELFDFKVNYFHNRDWNKSNSVKSIMCANSLFEKKTVIVSYSDIIYDESIIKSLIEYDGRIVVPYTTNWLEIWEKRFKNPLDDAESFKIDENGNIIEIGQSPSSIYEIQGQYLGILKITPDGWMDIKSILNNLDIKIINSLDITGLLNLLIKNNFYVKSIKTNFSWFEFDSQQDINVFKKYDLIKNFKK